MGKTQGVLLVLLAAFCFGTMPVLAHGAYAENVNVPTLLFQRFGIASILIWIAILVRREPLPKGKPLGLLVLMGSVVYFGQAFTLFEALRFLPAGLASILAFLYPVIVSIAAHFFMDDRLGRQRIFALAVAVLGMGLSIGPIGQGNGVGVFLALLSAVGAAAYILMGAKAPEDVSPLATNGVVLGSATLSFLVFGLAQGFSLTDVSEVEWAIGLSMASLIGIASLLKGLKAIGPVNASILLALEPITATVLGHTLLNQVLDPLQIAGGILIIGAVIMLVLAKGKTKAEQEVAI
ncbi:MAG: DMT family transporter [Fimbriimonas sp.]